MPEPVVADALDECDAFTASWWVAGFTSVCDWIGSSESWFEYTLPNHDDADLRDYWQLAHDRAASAIVRAGLASPKPAAARTFAQLTGIDETPTPAQQWAATVEIPSGPALFVVEDVTGAGKTEAAQVLTHRLLVDGRASGVYWAMPTQATANAMYPRQAKGLDALFDDAERKPSLVLAHGQRRLHSGFRATVLDNFGEPTLGRAEFDEDEVPGGPACAAWLANDRRASMLADVGVGTIDQALLAALPSKYNTIRLYGLAGKVLIVDEAHAYDAYMGVELDQLLCFHAALGGDAIVLSATLPLRRRRELVAAWVEGTRGGRKRFGEVTRLESNEYPLTTLASASRVVEQAIETPERARRATPVRFVHDIAEAASCIVQAARQGAAVAWVRNTVRDCLDAATLLRDVHGLEPLVFHARFAQGDRQLRENEVLERFGKDASADRRRGCVLVATQVIEQSLDIDFDGMVSDVAPIDLLIQRAGRLRRHRARDPERPRDVRGELVVLSPVPNPNPSAEWLAGPFAGTAKVYENPAILWRTIQALSENPLIEAPSGLRNLVELVYGSEIESPPSLLKGADRAETQEKVKAAAARYATLKVGDGYSASSETWLSDLRVPTRLGEKQTVIRLARVAADGTLVPWASAETPWQAWALSEVRVSSRQVPWDASPEPRFHDTIDKTREGWGPFDQPIVVMPLEEASDGTWRGRLERADASRPLDFSYSDDFGLSLGRRPIEKRAGPSLRSVVSAPSNLS